MKVQVIHIITLLELGGAQQLTLFTVERLDRARYQPHLIAGLGGVLDPEARQLYDVPVHFVPDLIREIRPHRDLLAFRRIRSTIRQIRRSHPGSPVVVHTHSSKAGILGRWAAWLEGVPTILHTYHGFGFHRDQRPWVRWIFRAAERWTGRITHALLMVSRANMEEARRSKISAIDRIVLIREGIPIQAFQEARSGRDRIRRSLAVEGEDPLVTMVSCLKPQKAPWDFVKVAQRVVGEEPRSHFLLVGDGALRGQVEAEVAACGLEGRLHLVGWRRDIPEILHASDLLVLTSRWEGLPLVLPQAMAAGLPIVATEVDGSPEAVQDGSNGFLVPPGDVERMARRVIELLRDPALRRRMAGEGTKRVREFDIERMLTEIEDLYDQMVEREVGGRVNRPGVARRMGVS